LEELWKDYALNINSFVESFMALDTAITKTTKFSTFLEVFFPLFFFSFRSSFFFYFIFKNNKFRKSEQILVSNWQIFFPIPCDKYENTSIYLRFSFFPSFLFFFL
jgi:hypothetical protein